MTSPEPEEAVACVDLRVRYEDGAEALRGVSFRQRRGELVAVLGATAAGKSTLLKCFNRTVPELKRAAVTGDVRIFGQPTAGLRVADLADRVGFVFQDFEAQLFSTSVQEEIVFGLEQLAVPSDAMAERIRWALDAVGLAGFERRDPTTLSGGEKQRLAIAAVLALRPGVLLLDEPSTDLDPAGRREIFALLARLRQGGASLLVAEHDLDIVLQADAILVLDEGRAAFAGPPAAVFARPADVASVGVRPPELASLTASLGVGTWPLDVDSVEARLRTADVRVRERPSAETGTPEVRAPILEIDAVRFRYRDAPQEALRGVTLALGEGELVAIVGGNGSGKSTLARHMNGLLRPSDGVVRWRGRPIAALEAAERAAAVGYVFQNPDEQIFAATVGEEVAFGPIHLRCPAAEIERRVRRALAAVDLESFEDRDPFLLGKGERQKVAVASVLSLAPAILVLDEPTTGLDFRETEAMMAVLRRLNEAGQTIVIITHVPWVVAAYARRAILMADGKILWDGDVRGLFERDDLCGEGDFLPPEVTRLGRRFGATPLTVEELLRWTERRA